MLPVTVRFSYKAYRRPFRVPVRTSRGLWEAREGIVIRLDNGEGCVGLGEIAPIPWFGTETLIGAIAWCTAAGKEAEVERLRETTRGLPCCAAALHAALAELEGEAPAELPRETKTKRLPVAALLPTGKDALETMVRAAERGFTVFKTKIGAGEFDAERKAIGQLAAKLPGQGKLRLDANGGLDARTTSRWLDAAEEWPVEFIEQPLSVDAGRDLLALANDHATPIALDESVRSADDIKRWRDRGWPGLFVIKPALAGDIAATMHEVALSPERFVFSSALETAVGARAGLRLALESETTRALGFGVAVFFAEDGLGGALATPWFGSRECASWPKAEDVWNLL